MSSDPKPCNERANAFWAKVDRGPECWEWTGARNKKKDGVGYGQFWDGSRSVLAHRYSYMLANGEVPEGKEIDHLCRNRLCVKPSHLEAVTRSENMLRAFAAEPRSVCKHGHALEGDNVYIRPGDGYRECVACKEERNSKKRVDYVRKVEQERDKALAQLKDANAIRKAHEAALEHLSKERDSYKAIAEVANVEREEARARVIELEEALVIEEQQACVDDEEIRQLREEVECWRDPDSPERQALLEQIIYDLGEGDRSEVELRESQVDALEAANASLRAEIERLKERIDELREASGESQKNWFVHANAKLDRKNQELRAEVERLKQELQEGVASTDATVYSYHLRYVNKDCQCIHCTRHRERQKAGE